MLDTTTELVRPLSSLPHEEDEVERAEPARAPALLPSRKLRLGRALREAVIDQWHILLFYAITTLLVIGLAVTASAQPAEVGGLPIEVIRSAASDPLASVYVALLFTLSQLVAAWRDWSKVRASELEAARLRIQQMEAKSLLDAEKIAQLTAHRDLAQLREGDIREMMQRHQPN